MPKNILVFIDGTGNEGGVLPDESRTNVYKLYRATRSGPDSVVDLSRQLAFYVHGIGTLEPVSATSSEITSTRRLAAVLPSGSSMATPRSSAFGGPGIASTCSVSVAALMWHAVSRTSSSYLEFRLRTQAATHSASNRALSVEFAKRPCVAFTSAVMLGRSQQNVPAPSRRSERSMPARWERRPAPPLTSSASGRRSLQ
jgi:hypothetical protein